MEEVELKNNINQKKKKINCQGIFIAIGHIPSTQIFKDKIDMDQNGYIIVEPGRSTTNLPGVFASGDVQDKIYRQAITSAGSGCMASLDAHKFLSGEIKKDITKNVFKFKINLFGKEYEFMINTTHNKYVELDLTN